MPCFRWVLLAVAVLGLVVRVSSAQMPAEDCPVCSGQAILGGAGFYLVTPYFENNPAFLANDKVNKQVRNSSRVDIEHDSQVAPFFWLGYLFESGLGGRARGWFIDSDTSQSLASPNRVVTAHPVGLSLIVDQARGIRVDSGLNVQVLDLECLQKFHGQEWDLFFSAGVRLTRIRQDYNAFVTAPDGFPLSLFSRHTFSGAGPVVAGEGRRALGNTGFALYGSARASLVFGTIEQTASIPVEDDQGRERHQRGLLVGEAELGIQYATTVFGTWVFGQVGVVGQNWFGAGSTSRSTVLTVPGGDFTGGGYTVDSDFAFLGVAFRLGIAY